MAYIPPETPPAEYEEHHEHVGRDPETGHEEDDARGGLRVLPALDLSGVGVVAKSVALLKDAGAGNAATHGVGATRRHFFRMRFQKLFWGFSRGKMEEIQ